MTLAARLRERLAVTANDPVPYANDMRASVETPGTPAAVLMALTDRPYPGVILTQRPDTMRNHAGQVAFPGGRVDPGDVDAVDAALREAEEEVALVRTHVDVVGTLSPYRTVTGFDIVPVLAVIPPDLPLVPHDREVAAVFEVPVAFLVDRANWAERHMLFEGRERRYLESQWETRRIWGATAAMLVNLGARLRW